MGETDNTEAASQETGGGEPWASALEHIPSQFHGDVKPALETWYQKFSQDVTKQYEPWKPFIDQKVDPSQLQNAWQLAAALEQDPVNTLTNIRRFYEQNGIKFEESVQQPNQQQQQPPKPLDFNAQDLDDPRLQAFAQQLEEIKKQNELMAQVLVRNNESEKAKQEDARVATEFENLHAKMKQKYGGRDFNEQFVGGLALATGMTLEQAAEAYYQEINATAISMQRPAPSVIGTGGGLPTSRPDVTKMGEQEFKNYATDYVRGLRGT